MVVGTHPRQGRKSIEHVIVDRFFVEVFHIEIVAAGQQFSQYATRSPCRSRRVIAGVEVPLDRQAQTATHRTAVVGGGQEVEYRRTARRAELR